MIDIKTLNKSYASKVALEIGQLRISKGECVGLVGNNGAGKTTLLSLILDLIKATKGEVFSKEIDVSKSDSWKFYTGSFLNENFLIQFLKPKEYLEFIGKFKGLSSTDVSEFLESNMTIFSENLFDDKRLIKDLSKGNKNKIGILGAMMGNPELLILDEPFANLDPSSQQWLSKKLKKLHEEGMTMIISSHNINHVTVISTRIVLLENGNIVKDLENCERSARELEEYFDVDAQ
jgi:ABC-2 type transport system ATP-binding protein